jgi:hypothetical protein
MAETDLLINFNRKGDAKRLLISADYYSFNGRLVQEWRFSSYQRFEAAIETRQYENKYVAATNYFGNGSIQRGIDLIEDIPGIANLRFSLFNYDTGANQMWT